MATTAVRAIPSVAWAAPTTLGSSAKATAGAANTHGAIGATTRRNRGWRRLGSARAIAPPPPRATVSGRGGHEREHGEHQDHMREIGNDARVGRPLREHPGHQRSDGEADGHRHRAAPGRRVVGDIPEGRTRQLAQPRRTGAEGRTAAQSDEEAPGEQERQGVAGDHERQRPRQRQRSRGQDDRPSAASVRQRPGDEQAGDQAQRVEAEHRLERARRQAELLAIDEQHRGELVGTPRRAEQRRAGAQPGGARIDAEWHSCVICIRATLTGTVLSSRKSSMIEPLRPTSLTHMGSIIRPELD